MHDFLQISIVILQCNRQLLKFQGRLIDFLTLKCYDTYRRKHIFHTKGGV